MPPPSQTPQLALHDSPRFRWHQVTRTIRTIVPANTILIGIHFQNIFRAIRIVLPRRPAFKQSPPTSTKRQ
jgi:hypothetical protein